MISYSDLLRWFHRYRPMVYHPPIPMKLTYSNDAVMVVSHRIKQPSKMGFKRGNRCARS